MGDFVWGSNIESLESKVSGFVIYFGRVSTCNVIPELLSFAQTTVVASTPFSHEAHTIIHLLHGDELGRIRNLQKGFGFQGLFSFMATSWVAYAICKRVWGSRVYPHSSRRRSCSQPTTMLKIYAQFKKPLLICSSASTQGLDTKL